MSRISGAPECAPKNFWPRLKPLGFAAQHALTGTFWDSLKERLLYSLSRKRISLSLNQSGDFKTWRPSANLRESCFFRI